MRVPGARVGGRGGKTAALSAGTAFCISAFTGRAEVAETTEGGGGGGTFGRGVVTTDEERLVLPPPGKEAKITPMQCCGAGPFMTSSEFFFAGSDSGSSPYKK